MIGDDPERRGGLLLRAAPEGRGGRIDQMPEKIGLKHAVDALQDAGHAFQSHAGVDRGTRQRQALLLRHLLELHEHQVPELRNRSPSSSGLPGGPPQMRSPRSMKISEHGPHGPVSPIAQKLSEVEMRMMRSSGRPAIFFQ